MMTPMTDLDRRQREAGPRPQLLGGDRLAAVPHVAPVWGVVVGDVLYVYTERSTVKARNLAVDARVAVHLESAEDVVIVHGEVEDLGPSRGSRHVLTSVAEYPSRAKYPDRRTRRTSIRGRLRRLTGAWRA